MKHHDSITPKIDSDVNLVSVDELLGRKQDVFNRIAERAYEIFESRGYVHGSDHDDWFLAEAELLKPIESEVLEFDDHIVLRTEILGFGPHEIKVSVEPHWLRIGGRMTDSKNGNAGGDGRSSREHSLSSPRHIFHVAELPAAVDPSEANLTFKDGVLEIVMPKATRTKSVGVEAKSWLPAPDDPLARQIDRIEVGSRPSVVTPNIEPILRTRAVSSRK